MKLHKHSLTDLAKAAEHSISLRQVLLKLQVAPCGGNYAALRKAIAHFGLDISRFSGQAWKKGMTLSPRQPNC